MPEAAQQCVVDEVWRREVPIERRIVVMTGVTNAGKSTLRPSSTEDTFVLALQPKPTLQSLEPKVWEISVARLSMPWLLVFRLSVHVVVSRGARGVTTNKKTHHFHTKPH